MIKVTLTIATSETKVTTREEVIENVTVIDCDDDYLRIITGEGEMHKINQVLVIGYTAEVI